MMSRSLQYRRLRLSTVLLLWHVQEAIPWSQFSMKNRRLTKRITGKFSYVLDVSSCNLRHCDVSRAGHSRCHTWNCSFGVRPGHAALYFVPPFGEIINNTIKKACANSSDIKNPNSTTECIYVFSKTLRINNDYFPKCT